MGAMRLYTRSGVSSVCYAVDASVMKTRLTWCITLFLLCHHVPAVWGVANQLPQASAPAGTQSLVPQQTKPAPEPAPPDDVDLSAPLNPDLDPAFSLPSAAARENSAPPAPAPPVTEQPGAELLPAPTGVSEIGFSEVIDTGSATPIDAPPVGTPVHIEADKQGRTGDTFHLDGDVLLLYKSYRVRADHVTYNRATSMVEAQGHLSVEGGPSDEHLFADHGTMNLEDHTGHFYDATGTLGVRTVTRDRFVFTAPNPFALTGKEVLELGPGRYQVLHGTLTSCRLPHPDWQLIARDILVKDGTASARNSTFTLFNAPLLYLPYISHPLAPEHRQSGILLPIFGNDTQRGFIVGEAGYIVMGRSADATVGSEYFSRRGFAPFGQLRYRGQGENFASFRLRSLLDRLPGTLNQGGVDLFFRGRRKLDDYTQAVADVEYLSSYVYRQAFEENFSAAINSEVKSSAFVTREGNGFAANGRFERYQTFRSATLGDEIRVLHEPELQLDALDHPIRHTPLLWGGEAAAAALSRSEPGFSTSSLVPRLDLYPHLALPLSAAGWTLRGEAGVRNTFYGKSQQPGVPGSVPAAELGASLDRFSFNSEAALHPPTLRRDFSSPFTQRLFGGELRHTVEPELTYRYVTGVNHFADTLRFDDTDIVTDTNQVEYALTQHVYVRHLHAQPCKGDEALGPNSTCGHGTTDWLTWKIAQQHYFNPTFGGAVLQGQRNVLATTLDLTGIAFLSGPRNNSPIISRLRLRTTSATDLEWDLDYNVRNGRVQGSNLLASYRVNNYFVSIGDARLFNVTPQVARLPSAPNPNSTSTLTGFNQLRLATAYGSPTKHGISAGANLGYDFTLNQRQYLGLQAGYNRDCCGLAFEMRRYSLGVVRNDTQYLFSFTLAGVGSAGSLRPVLRVF